MAVGRGDDDDIGRHAEIGVQDIDVRLTGTDRGNQSGIDVNGRDRRRMGEKGQRRKRRLIAIHVIGGDDGGHRLRNQQVEGSALLDNERTHGLHGRLFLPGLMSSEKRLILRLPDERSSDRHGRESAIDNRPYQLAVREQAPSAVR